jgi:hypothetical protein
MRLILSWRRGSNEKAKIPPHSPEMARKISETSAWQDGLNAAFSYPNYEAGH